MANILPLPAPATILQTRLTYFLIGIFIGLLIFARVTSWIVKTTTRLTRQLILRLAAEIINQLAHLTSTGLPFLPGSKSPSDAIRLSNPIIIDTSALIDGRILDVARTKFLSGIFLVPNFVLTELQQVADSADNLKRARGRRGFKIIEELKRIEGVKLEIWDKDLAGKAVDDKLLRLGKILHGKVLTCDFNLNRVAAISGVTVLNLNELANALKALPVPGETIDIKIVHIGKDRGQGVGYLADGTMVVVKDASSQLNQTIKVEVAKILQGAAGRMIFAELPA